MCGNIFGGWIMARSAIKAYNILKNNEEDKFLNDNVN